LCGRFRREIQSWFKGGGNSSCEKKAKGTNTSLRDADRELLVEAGKLSDKEGGGISGRPFKLERIPPTYQRKRGHLVQKKTKN